MALVVYLTLYFSSTLLWAQYFIIELNIYYTNGFQNKPKFFKYHLSICYSLLVFNIHLNKNLLEKHFIPEECVSFLSGVFILYPFIPLYEFIRIYNSFYTESSPREGITLHICGFEIPLSITVMNIYLWIE